MSNRVAWCVALVALLLLPLAPARADDSAAKAKAEGPATPAADPAAGSLPVAWSEELGWRSIGPANMGGRITDARHVRPR